MTISISLRKGTKFFLKYQNIFGFGGGHPSEK